MAISGFPSEKANGEQISSFLRGMAKLEGIKADYANFKAEYISGNGSERGMLQEWKSQGKFADEKAKPEGLSGQSYLEGTVIRNPSTGQEMIMRGGEWVAK
jgi:hypothetical protein